MHIDHFTAKVPRNFEGISTRFDRWAPNLNEISYMSIKSFQKLKLKIFHYFASNKAMSHLKKQCAFLTACQEGKLDEVEVLLKDKKVNPANGNNEAIRWASENGQIDVARLLLTDDRVNPADMNNDAIRGASENGQIDVVRLLLTDDRVNPADWKNDAICQASYNGHIDVVRLLLTDDRVNPADQDNQSIRWASQNGHVDVVKHLLEDSRVNPADYDNLAIGWASCNGHINVVKLLLEDFRVNPADNDNLAIGWASQNNHVAVVNLLQESRRVMALKSYERKQGEMEDMDSYMRSVSETYVKNYSFMSGESKKPICDDFCEKYVAIVKKNVEPYLKEIGDGLLDLPEDVIRHCVLPYVVGYQYK